MIKGVDMKDTDSSKNKLKQIKQELESRRAHKIKLTQKIMSIYSIKGRSKTAYELERYDKLCEIRKINNSKISDLTQEIANFKDGDIGTVANQLVKYHHNKFVEIFGDKPFYSADDYAIANTTLKRLLGDYTADELKVFIAKYLKLKDNFLMRSGYRLQFLPNSIASLIVNKDLRETSEKNDFRSKDYNHNIEDWQLFDYMESKEKDECDGTESWAKPLEREIKRRNLTQKDLLIYKRKKHNE